MNSDRVLIIAVPLFVAVLVHVAFLVAIEGEWNTSEATVVAKAQVVQASLVSLKTPKKSPPKPKPKSKPKPKTKLRQKKSAKHVVPQPCAIRFTKSLPKHRLLLKQRITSALNRCLTK